jgi:hypothetical protein
VEKVFKMSDEPSCPEISEDEHRRIQIEVLNNPNYKYIENMKLKEINMEKEAMSKQKDRTKQANEILNRMTSQMNSFRLMKVDKGEEYDKSESYESKEKERLNSINLMTLAINYFKESDIPLIPLIKAEKVFDYMDNDIPKIENEEKKIEVQARQGSSETYPYQGSQSSQVNEKFEIMSLIQKFIIENRIPNQVSCKLFERIQFMKGFTVEDLPRLYSEVIDSFKFQNHGVGYGFHNIPYSNQIFITPVVEIAPAAKRSESPGKNGVTTNPVSIKIIKNKIT